MEHLEGLYSTKEFSWATNQVWWNKTKFNISTQRAEVFFQPIKQRPEEKKGSTFSSEGETKKKSKAKGNTKIDVKQTWLRLCVPPVWRLSRVDSLWLGHLRTKKEKKESEVAQLCPTLCDPTDCGLPGPSVRRIFQVRILEWVVSSFSRGESSPGGSDGKASACNEGDPGSIPGSGKSPGEGNGNPLQYSCLENSMDRGAW